MELFMSMIIGRKQIILAALVLALGTAIFLNWRFSGSNVLSSVFSPSSTLGNASFVDNQNVAAASGDSYFAAARLTREQDRGQAEELLKTQTTNASATATEKTSAEAAVEAMAANINTEGQIEGLVKAKGFVDCMAYISSGSVNIVVKPKTGDTLTESDLAQIYDIAMLQTKLSLANIKIIPSK
jgi:stage III sporulation protein AH